MTEKRYLLETELLDFSSPRINALVEERGWNRMCASDALSSVYSFVKDEIPFGYNRDDALSASEVLSDGYGQCNTKAVLLMALLRACSVECRIHGFTIDKRLQKGAMTGIVYALSPKNVFHSWVEARLDSRWYILEGVILDRAYLEGLRRRFPLHSGAFSGYGVAVDDFRHPAVDFAFNDTFIQSMGINADFGVYDTPDLLLASHHQNMSFFRSFLYRNIGRRLMNRNVRRIREG